MKINLKIFANPYYLFSIAWAFCLFFYSLRWAMIYPEISITLMIFVMAAVIANLFFGIIFQKLTSIYATFSNKVFNVNYLMIFNSLLWLINFLYAGVPLLSVIRGGDFDHTVSFGIPSLIVFVMSFNSFLSLLTFYYYIKLKQKKYLFFFIVNNLFFVLIFSRGSIMLVLLASFFLWLFVQKKAITIGKITAILASFLLVLYLFGVAGNYRIVTELKNTRGIESEYSNNIILAIADASPDFKKNFVPSEFMWGYVYLTSPIGNLQENINDAKVHINFDNAVAYIVNEFTFDFMSKRIQQTFNIKKYEEYRFTPELTVPTTFAEAYLYLGWLGIIIYLVAILLFPIAYFLLVRKFPLWQLGMSVMCCIYFFSIFDNMFIYSGLSLQLIFPFMFLNKGKI